MDLEGKETLLSQKAEGLGWHYGELGKMTHEHKDPNQQSVIGFSSKAV